MKAPILCLALLLSSVSAHAILDVGARPEGSKPLTVSVPCRFNTQPPSYEADSKECRFLLGLEKLVERLTAAADFKSGEIPLSRTVGADSEYFAAFTYKSIFGLDAGRKMLITDGFVRCHRDDPEPAAYVIAHEIGHAIQLREGASHEFDRSPRSDDPATSRRFEAQADALGAEILRRAGITPQPSRTWDVLLACTGGVPDYVDKDSTHPGLPTRWVEGVLQRERTKEEARIRGAEERQLEEARRRADKMRIMLAAGSPWAAPTMSAEAATKGWSGVLRRNDWKRISDDGRHDGGVRGVIKTDVPQPFTADRAGRIRLPGGKMWLPPPGLLRYLSPAEIIAYATRGPIPPETIQEGFKRGVEYLMKTQDWSKLPGEVTDR